MSTPDIWNAIRAFYCEHQADIMHSRSEWGVMPYSWECTGLQMSPIESLLWSDIRCLGAVLYPQYPVAGFFLDFGNPVARVAIECDGAEFHKDREKDMRRDDRLRSLGWEVYRFTGRQCHEDTEDGYNDDGAYFIEPSETYKRLSHIASTHGLIVGTNRGAL
jgi:REase_MTES_1575